MKSVFSYVMSKLTLHVPDDLVAVAKLEAAERETSVSRMVSDYFRTLSGSESRKGTANALSPVTASLIGCARGADDAKKAYVDFLEEKHS